MTTTGVPGFNIRPGATAIAATAALLAGLVLPLQAGEVAQKPLTLAVSSYQPNIQLILDNSNTMAEGLTGTVAAECDPGPDADCVAGAASPLSKSEMIRSVGRQLIDDYRGQINLGLMAYQQYPLGDEFSDIFDDRIWLARLGNRLYDVSYDPANFDSVFSGSPWDSTTKAFRTENPNDDGHIHYNVGVPGYGPADNSQFCFTRDPDGGYQTENFRFRCFGSKIGTDDTVPDDNNDPGFGFSSHQGTTAGSLTDSARARGVTHWGRHMVFLQFNHPEWLALGSPGLGYLHTPIQLLNDEHAALLAAKLAAQHHETDNDDLLTDPDEPVIVAGLTPLEGTLHTARTYFEGQGASNSSTFGPDQGWREDLPAMPESCGVNAAIWLTDGMPSVAMDGTALGDDVDQALDDAVDAAAHLHGEGTDTEVDVYVVGFGMPPNVPADALDRLAEAGGTETPFLANNPADLFAAINEIFQQIISMSQAEFGSVSSGSVAVEGALGFRTMADPSDWTGDLIGLVDPNLDTEDEIWRASEHMPDNLGHRHLLTANRAFTEAAFAADLAFEELYDQRDEPIENEVIARNLIRYVKGGAGNTDLDELAPFNIVPFERDGVIGAFNRGNPTIQRVRSFGWFRLPEDEGGGSIYTEFVEEKQGLREVVYVGSNLGVLHAFDLRSGEEIFGYVPRGVYPNLRNMVTQDFQYTVDGEVRLFDAWDGSQWRQILVGTLGAGGRSVFALDVTNPDQPEVLWEVTHEDLVDSELADPEHLGLTFSAAEPARLPSGEWVVVMGNGYHSDSNEARLLVLDLFDEGRVLHNVLLGDAGSPSGPANGLSTPRIAQDFSSRLVRSRYVYAGDLQGNLWRVELGESKNQSLQAERLFNGDRPITMQPQTIYPEQRAGYLVAFGTGKFFEVNDDNIIGAPTEYFYVINDTGPGGPGQTNLTQSALDDRTPGGSSTEFDLYDGASGWYVALDHGGRTGARALFTPDELIGAILFTSFRPSDDPCEVGGTTEVYMMSLRFGEGAFPIGGGATEHIVTSYDGAPVSAIYAPRPRPVDPDTGEETASTVISVGDQMIDVDDPDFDAAAMPRAFGERVNWRQTR
jgi:type IV pilus assembly protein PilY1